MEKKKYQKLSVTTLIISVLPLVTLIPALLHIKLADSVRSAWEVLLSLPCLSVLFNRKNIKLPVRNLFVTIYRLYGE